MIHSKHVIKVIKAYKSQSRHYLITELCNSGDLSTLMDVRRHLTEDEARIILKQIVIGLRDINKGRVIHRDMKLANILLHFPNEDLLALKKEERKAFLKNVNLLETPFEIKISDFGFAKAKNLPGENREHSICGTPAYMAPDQVVGKDTHYTEKFDIWALGAMFYELLVGIPPFIERTIEKFKHKLYEGSYEFPENVIISPEGVHFISRCLQYKEENRASIFELHGDPYIRNFKPKKAN